MAFELVGKGHVGNQRDNQDKIERVLLRVTSGFKPSMFDAIWAITIIHQPKKRIPLI